MQRKTIQLKQKRYKVPYYPSHLTPKQYEEYDARALIAEEELMDLMPEPSNVVDEYISDDVNIYFKTVHGITLSLMEKLLYSSAGIIAGGDDIGYNREYLTNVGEVMAFMAAYEGCTLNGVVKHVVHDYDPKGYIRMLYITSMVYTGQPTKEFWDDINRLMPLKWNPHRDEFLILANSDDDED